ncbi:ABC transporter substrate-binding protein [Gordonia hydrophobica]|uniref:ABC transporter substrate-binding protein n=1 Tax=Gordonia hydrophobica TaxID=40516 RepID=A0ABZ2U4R8_9ACTN|nr:ABC transporter substrate-binding protein [Gordonia hydrophobica]MBM7368295.1 iron complex transport system substrate-binding protein [Gordonia hydrophobica]
MSLRTRLAGSAVVALLAVSALAACGESEKVDDSAAAAAGEGTTSYPLTIENCGTSQTFTEAPQRVVSLDQGSTEILLSLGLADRIQGTASWTDPVLESLAEANSTVKRLADNAPTYEVVMGTNPDFVTASFGRHFKKEGGVATRERLAETDVETYLSPTDCEGSNVINGGGTRTKPLTIDSLYQEISELSQIFDVPERGQQLVDELKSRTAAATEKVKQDGRTVAFWFADTKTPYIAGGLGSAQLIATTVGTENVFSDLDDDWPATTWSAVVQRNPQVLVLGDLQRARFPGDLLAEKKTFLESDPVTKVMPAVQKQQYVALHGAEMNPSIRMVDGIEKLAAWLSQNPA